MRISNLSSISPIQKVVTTSGTPEKLSGYYIATTIAFTAGVAGVTRDTITDSGSLFLKKGFQAGDLLVVSGSTTSDGTYEIYSVVAGTITLNTYQKFISEIAGDTVTLDTVHGIKVETGVEVVVQAKSSNTGIITIGGTSAKALNTNTDYFSNKRLANSEAVSVQVQNLNQIWFDATVSGEGVEILFEK